MLRVEIPPQAAGLNEDLAREVFVDVPRCYEMLPSGRFLCGKLSGGRQDVPGSSETRHLWLNPTANFDEPSRVALWAVWESDV